MNSFKEMDLKYRNHAYSLTIKIISKVCRSRRSYGGNCSGTATFCGNHTTEFSGTSTSDRWL